MPFAEAAAPPPTAAQACWDFLTQCICLAAWMSHSPIVEVSDSSASPSAVTVPPLPNIPIAGAEPSPVSTLAVALAAPITAFQGVPPWLQEALGLVAWPAPFALSPTIKCPPCDYYSSWSASWISRGGSPFSANATVLVLFFHTRFLALMSRLATVQYSSGPVMTTCLIFSTIFPPQPPFFSLRTSYWCHIAHRVHYSGCSALAAHGLSMPLAPDSLSSVKPLSLPSSRGLYSVRHVAQMWSRSSLTHHQRQQLWY
ncbi:hypothetical protein B0H13DRAFT_1912477 [Mycena leptocephala]|nr:hypothetical protein B0H13DRAFT_1912477 [Mycena leptocephala]